MDLNVPKHLKEAVASAGGAVAMMAGSPLDDAPSETVELEVQTEHVAFSVAAVGAGLPAGGLTVATASEHDAVLSLPSSNGAMRRPEMGTTMLPILPLGGCTTDGTDVLSAKSLSMR